MVCILLGLRRYFNRGKDTIKLLGAPRECLEASSARMKEKAQLMKDETYLRVQEHKRRMVISSKDSLIKRGYYVVDNPSDDEVDKLYQVISDDIDKYCKELRRRK